MLFAGEDITLQWLESKPRSVAKDFYIWRYLDQEITPEQAIKALGGAKYVNNSLFFRYAKKLKHDETYGVYQCMKATPGKLITQHSDCIEVGLSAYKATKLDRDQLEMTSAKIKKKYPIKASVLDIFRGTIPFTKLISSKAEVFFETFNECGSKYREEYFNHKFPKRTLKRLSKHKKFEQTIKLIVTNPRLNKLSESILEVDDTLFGHHGSFFLAVNAIIHDKRDLALNYLQNAYKKAYYQFDKDKVLFWQYKLSDDSKYLEMLSKSWDVNIYSIYANSEFGKEHPSIVFSSSSENNATSDYDIKDPFSWLNVLRDTKKMNDYKMLKYEKLFGDKETLGHLDFVKERHERYRKSFFSMPFREHLEGLDTNRTALIYAIARQESRFIPSSISTAYAMGVMQIMPFLSKAIAKELKEVYDIDSLLDPYVNLKYANHHLNFLEKRVEHPLFIAYAYNGGIGFTRKTLNKGIFKTKNDLEPFLSMELIPYDETRKYGKKVLANYYIYQRYLNDQEKIGLNTLLQTALWSDRKPGG